MIHKNISAPRNVTNTIWENPTNDHTFVDIMKEPGRWWRYNCEPHGTVSIPSEYDYAIQRVEHGVIQGGLAPLWRKQGQAQLPELHPSLDTERALEKELAVKAAEVLRTKEAAEVAVAVAAARLENQRHKREAAEASIMEKFSPELDVSSSEEPVKRGPGRPPKA